MAHERCDMVSELLKKPFSSRTFQDKLEIIANGRPTPNLSSCIKKECNDRKRSYNRAFGDENYKNYEWITGSVTLEKVLCWPCLLFSQERYSNWVSKGFGDLNNLSKSAAMHQNSVAHKTSMITLATFGTGRIELALDKHRNDDVLKHNAMVNKQKEVLKRLIDVVCFLAKQELAFRGHNESLDSFNRGNYIELLKHTAMYDPILEHHLDTATVFKGTSAEIQNDLIECVANVIRLEIRKEIKLSPFISIMADESSDVSNKEQLSIAVRYVKSDGEVVERFIDYCDVSGSANATVISTEILKVLQSFCHCDQQDCACKRKLVAQAYDGAAVMSSSLNGVQAKVKNVYPSALFVHCYAHQLNLTLSHSVSWISKCKIFFLSLNGLVAFFTTSPKRNHLFETIVKRKFPNVCPTRWNYNSRIIVMILDYFNEICEVFETMWENQLEWKDQSHTDILARGHLAQMQSFEFAFLVTLFSEIFSHTEKLFDILQTKAYDIGFCLSKVAACEKVLSDQRNSDEHFEKCWNKAVDLVGEPQQQRSAREKDETNSSPKETYQRLLREVLDNITGELNRRFSYLNSMKFVELLNPEKYSSHGKEFPEDCLNSLKTEYGQHFEFSQLKSELTSIYQSPEFTSFHAQDITRFLHEKKLKSAFPQLYKLACLILTIPSTTATVERSFSLLKRIKTFLRNRTGQKRLCSLALISIEKELLRYLRLRPDFYDSIIAEFVKKTRRVELIPK